MVRAAGIFAVLIGLILAFAAFFVLQQSLIINPPEYEIADMEKQVRATRAVSAGAIYVIVFGIANVIIGFFGALNADNDDMAKKCLQYGIAVVIFCVVNGILLSVIGDFTKPLSLVFLGLPLLADGVYLLGAYLKYKNMPHPKPESEQTE